MILTFKVENTAEQCTTIIHRVLSSVLQVLPSFSGYPGSPYLSDGNRYTDVGLFCVVVPQKSWEQNSYVSLGTELLCLSGNRTLLALGSELLSWLLE